MQVDTFSTSITEVKNPSSNQTRLYQIIDRLNLLKIWLYPHDDLRFTLAGYCEMFIIEDIVLSEVLLITFENIEPLHPSL